ncbi:MAG: DUF4350 domain-containing protein [Candidatus Brocadiia bacterium]
MAHRRASEGPAFSPLGLALVLAGLAVSGVGLAVFAPRAVSPQATWRPAALAVLCAVAGLALVELGSWRNGAFYRWLGGSAARPWVEGAGLVALVGGLIVLANSLALAWMGLAGLGGVVAGVVAAQAGLALQHRAVVRVCTSASFPLVVMVAGAGLLGAAALGLVSVLNVRYYRRADLTERGFYSLDERTEAILDQLDRELRIVSTMAVSRPERPGREHAPLLRRRTNQLLAEYAKHSRRVEFAAVDPERDPDSWAEAEDRLGTALPIDAVALKYGERTRVVRLRELEGPGRPGTAPAFKGEQVFTTAVQAVLEAEPTMVCFVTGHGEKDVGDHDPREGLSELASRLRAENCRIATCRLPDIPGDCDVLVIPGPRLAFTEPELEALRRFLAEGGGLAVMLDPVLARGTPSGLEPLLAEQGIEARIEWTILDLARVLRGAGPAAAVPTATLTTTEYGAWRRGGPVAQAHPVTRELEGLRAGFHIACPLRSASGAAGERPYTLALVRSSSESYVREGFDPGEPSTWRREEGDPRGPFALVVARGPWGRGELPPGAPRPAPGRLLVFGDSDFAANRFLGRGTVGNAALLLNGVAWLAGKEYKVGIPPTPLSERRQVELSPRRRARAWWALVFAPAFHVVLAGLMVWWARHR